ncbi:hypothetical protein DFH05DRAFT_1475596 [Lentinula detonsa]|uniref:RNI-like protein n=1 Tax=Lentinula detonsa TaxID=2804962 RepID=A0A9W8P8T0_9AGAR|nr:hypothetical protein DFH05DRAFT_1475596 [Lentinula detonsa]
MERPWDLLPELLLDKLVRTILSTCPSLRLDFLSSFGSRIHSSAARVLFTCLEVEDDCRLFNCAARFQRSCVYPLLSNQSRYSHIVRSLIITNPIHIANQDQNSLDIQASVPLSADEISCLLRCCCNLEDFRWESSLRPPDSICELLSTLNLRLRRFHFNPCQLKSFSRRTVLVKWDAPSLALLSTLPITTLSLSGLSQAGTRAFARMLSDTREDSFLENLDIDLIWLDETICEAITEAGKKIRRLRISTNGTKFNDKGLISIMEACESMEELTLADVQGRISRLMWTKPATFPPALRCLRIHISETGPNHSWAVDHLDSLHAFPLEQLSEICISRRPGLPTIHNRTVIHEDRVDSVVTLKPLPATILERLRGCKRLTKLDCDFWSISISDLKVLLESCPKLENLKICLDAPFAKLLGLASTFATLSRLHTISVSINYEHAPGTPPPTALPNIAMSLSPGSEAPILNRKSTLPQMDQMQTQTCLEKDTGDTSFPLLREVKRFVRKCPKLELLEWYGKIGRGSWIVKRPIHNSKNSFNVSVNYIPPSISVETWEAIMREDQIQNFFSHNPSWIDKVRPGQDWTGEQAKLMAASLAEEKDEGVEITRRTETRTRRVLSISTSSSSTSDINMPSTPSRNSVSPVDVYSPSTSPLESPTSSRYGYRDLGADSPSRARDHKRSPSEPITTLQRFEQTRNDSSTTVTRRAKPGRGRGRGRGLRKVSMDEGQKRIVK